MVTRPTLVTIYDPLPALPARGGRALMDFGQQARSFAFFGDRTGTVASVAAVSFDSPGVVMVCVCRNDSLRVLKSAVHCSIDCGCRLREGRMGLRQSAEAASMGSFSRCSIIRRHVRGRKMKPQSTRPTAERVEDNIQCNLDNSTAELVRLLEECSDAQPTEAAIREATA